MNYELLTPEELTELQVKAQLKSLLIRGFNLYAKNQRTIMTKDVVEKLINDEVEKILKEE